jgi:hypothetical protein
MPGAVAIDSVSWEWSIRHYSRSRTFPVNERNSNNKSLKDNAEKTTENMKIFQIVGMDQMEQRSVVLFLRLKGLSKKAIRYELVAVLQENAVSCSCVTRFCSAGRLFWARMRKGPYHRPKMMASMK